MQRFGCRDLHAFQTALITVALPGRGTLGDDFADWYRSADDASVASTDHFFLGCFWLIGLKSACNVGVGLTPTTALSRW